jgi:alpha-soluble NSF attachment protein
MAKQQHEGATLMGVAINAKESLADGHSCMARAEKTLTRRGGKVANAPNLQFEDITYLYQRAAEAFRQGEAWQEACDAYAKAADTQLHLNCSEEAAAYSTEAAETMGKINPAESIIFYRNAISLNCEVGKFGIAGRLQRKLAERYEEDRNVEDAITQYRQASDYYLGEGLVAQSDLCLAKVAYYQGLNEEFEKSSEIYANLGLRCLDSNLISLNAREHFLRSGLCLLGK